MNIDKPDVLSKFSAQIGELAQHHLSHDENVVETSNWYYGILQSVLNRNNSIQTRQPPRYLEIACYRHILGYMLAKDRGFESTQFDISDRDLEIGHKTAIEMGYTDTVERVAGDFHDLPFSDNYFDMVMISASIHHTKTPDKIISEAMRVLTNGGLFYCQREPCQRLFCFYQFRSNRPEQHTPFEAYLHENDLMRLVSSPYPGTRNAEMFGRVENDRIPLDMYYDVFNRYGRVIEEVLYHESLLTKMDKQILEKCDLPEAALSSYIKNLVMDELGQAETKLSVKDRLIGHSLPTEDEIDSISKRTAAALKARPTDTSSLEWKKAMANIFGASLRFVVERQRPESERAEEKFRRTCQTMNGVKLDDAVYKNSGLLFWDKLLPDLQNCEENEIIDVTFPAEEWYANTNKNGGRAMVSKSSAPTLKIKLSCPALVIMRYRVAIDENFPVAKLRISQGSRELSNELFAQAECRMLHFVNDQDENEICFNLMDMEGNQLLEKSRIRVSILQCIPINKEIANK